MAKRFGQGRTVTRLSTSNDRYKAKTNDKIEEKPTAKFILFYWKGRTKTGLCATSGASCNVQDRGLNVKNFCYKRLARQEKNQREELGLPDPCLK